jgi:hypothetical protein
MNSLQELTDGLKTLEPFLTRHGFTLDNYENGKGSGGQFTIATYKNGDKKFVIGYRFSIGELYYQCDDLKVGHSFYLQEMGHFDKMKFPDFQSDDKMKSFQHILEDFELIKSDFFEGKGEDLKRIAKIQEKYVDVLDKEGKRGYNSQTDLANIRMARQEFKDKNYNGALGHYNQVKLKELLTDLDLNIISTCNEKVM